MLSSNLFIASMFAIGVDRLLSIVCSLWSSAAKFFENTANFAGTNSSTKPTTFVSSLHFVSSTLSLWSSSVMKAFRRITICLFCAQIREKHTKETLATLYSAWIWAWFASPLSATLCSGCCCVAKRPKVFWIHHCAVHSFVCWCRGLRVHAEDSEVPAVHDADYHHWLCSVRVHPHSGTLLDDVIEPSGILCVHHLHFLGGRHGRKCTGAFCFQAWKNQFSLHIFFKNQARTTRKHSEDNFRAFSDLILTKLSVMHWQSSIRDCLHPKSAGWHLVVPRIETTCEIKNNSSPQMYQPQYFH